MFKSGGSADPFGVTLQASKTHPRPPPKKRSIERIPSRRGTRLPGEVGHALSASVLKPKCEPPVEGGGVAS